MPVCSQSAQAVTGKEAFAVVKTTGTSVNDGGIAERILDTIGI